MAEQDVVRVCRALITSELLAINDYEEAIRNSTGFPVVTAVLTSIANEERVHVGELISLLHELSQPDASAFISGVEEAGRFIPARSTPPR